MIDKYDKIRAWVLAGSRERTRGAMEQQCTTEFGQQHMRRKAFPPVGFCKAHAAVAQISGADLSNIPLFFSLLFPYLLFFLFLTHYRCTCTSLMTHCLRFATLHKTQLSPHFFFSNHRFICGNTALVHLAIQ